MFGIQAIFATCEEPLLATETSKVDAIVPFRDSPSLHDLGKLLWFMETEAPDYRLRKVRNYKHARRFQLQLTFTLFSCFLGELLVLLFRHSRSLDRIVSRSQSFGRSGPRRTRERCP